MKRFKRKPRRFPECRSEKIASIFYGMPPIDVWDRVSKGVLVLGGCVIEINGQPALERDLLACVERLVTACETSAVELSGLEARSTKRLQAQLDGSAACATLLMRSQIGSMQALRGLLSEEATYNALDAKLNESLSLARDTEERLRQR